MKVKTLTLVLAALMLCTQSAVAEKDSILKSDPELNKGPKVYGYVQVQVVNLPVDTNGDNQSDPGRARVQRARFSVEGVINERISYELDIDPRPPRNRRFHEGCLFQSQAQRQQHATHRTAEDHLRLRESALVQQTVHGKSDRALG